MSYYQQMNWGWQIRLADRERLSCALVLSTAGPLSVTTLGHVDETGSGHFLFPQLRKKGGGGSGSQDARRSLLFQVTVPKWRSDFKEAHTDLSNETAKSGAVSY